MLTANWKKVREKILISDKVDHRTNNTSKALRMSFHNDKEKNELRGYNNSKSMCTE